jgi:hypothetical protein
VRAAAAPAARGGAGRLVARGTADGSAAAGARGGGGSHALARAAVDGGGLARGGAGSAAEAPGSGALRRLALAPRSERLVASAVHPAGRLCPGCALARCCCASAPRRWLCAAMMALWLTQRARVCDRLFIACGAVAHCACVRVGAASLAYPLPSGAGAAAGAGGRQAVRGRPASLPPADAAAAATAAAVSTLHTPHPTRAHRTRRQGRTRPDGTVWLTRESSRIYLGRGMFVFWRAKCTERKLAGRMVFMAQAVAARRRCQRVWARWQGRRWASLRRRAGLKALRMRRLLDAVRAVLCCAALPRPAPVPPPTPLPLPLPLHRPARPTLHRDCSPPARPCVVGLRRGWHVRLNHPRR